MIYDIVMDSEYMDWARDIEQIIMDMSFDQ